MKYHKIYRQLLLVIIIAILISPLFYLWTGQGQAAASLSAELVRQANGTLASSPKAEALHSLTLPMGLERMFLCPLLLLAFQFSGGALALRGWLDQRGLQLSRPGRALGWLTRRFPQSWRERLLWPDLPVVFFFVVIFEITLALLYLPFDFYQGFTVAHQFGLSTQTALSWANDWFKTLLINLVVNGLLWTGFYALLRLFPRRWPIPTGALLILVSLVFVLLTPILITPLFYQVQPLADSGLRTRILALADRAGMHVQTVEVIDASSKTTEVNAYFTGFGGAQRIVLYDTLLADYTPDQVEVVLAHEMGHWYYHHVLIGMLGMGAAAWLGLFGLRWLLQRTWRLLRLNGPADVAGLPYLLAVVAVVSLFTMPVENGISRYAERQADHFALVTSHKPAVFTDLFEKFAVQNLSQVDAPAWEKFLFYTHPSIAERLRMAQEFSQPRDNEHTLPGVSGQ